MKIGIQTQPLTANYGGILQNYALQTVLRRMGHEVWTLDVGRYTWFNWCFDMSKHIVKKLIKRQTWYPVNPFVRRREQRPLRCFVYNNINLTRRVKNVTWSLVKQYNLDTLVVGSDQVWRPIYNASIEDMFFGFAANEEINKLAYAASFGTDQWEFSYSQTKKCAELVKQFKAISVREDSGVDLCHNYLGVKATHVLDPTLLLTANDYNLLCNQIEKRQPFVFAYILDIDEQKITEIKEFAQKKGLPYFIKSAGPNIQDSDSVELWLSYFRDAAFVITDSFHGTAFSINYNKEFCVFANEERGNSRFDSLLKLFNLKHRVVDSINPSLTSINWTDVNQMLENERSRCQEWLELALN